MSLDPLIKPKRTSPVRDFGALSFGVRDDVLVRQDPSAIYQELMMTTPYAQTHRDVSYANDTVSLHSHEFYELLLCRSDCSLEYLVGTDRYSLQKGDIILIRPGVSHRPLLRKDLSVPYRRDVLWVSTDLMEVLAQMDEEHAGDWGVNLLRTKGTQWEFLCNLFHEGVKESKQKNPGWRSMVLGNTIQLLTELMRACRDGQELLAGREQTALLERIMAYLEDNFAERITLADTASHFYVSESTITHTFHSEMGVSFYRCLTQLRLPCQDADPGRTSHGRHWADGGVRGLFCLLSGLQEGIRDFSKAVYAPAFSHERQFRRYQQLPDRRPSGFGASPGLITQKGRHSAALQSVEKPLRGFPTGFCSLLRA